MFTGLGLIDWIALVVAALLLAGAMAAVALGTMARNHRRRTPRAAAATAMPQRSRPPMTRSSPPTPDVPDVIDLRDGTGGRRARADRARSLREHPEAEQRPPSLLDAPASPKQSVGRSMEVRARAGFELRSPGFFEDPIGRHELRYWDGERWTEHVKESGQRFIDPL